MQKIMFNDQCGLTDAVLERRKTMTRRIIPEVVIDLPRSGRVKVSRLHVEHGVLMMDLSNIMGEPYVTAAPRQYQPRYKIGEVVAIAQSYSTIVEDPTAESFLIKKELMLDNGCVLTDLFTCAGSRNKMFVRADWMPHHIRITDIKGERLQDIKGDDYQREGIVKHDYADRYSFIWNCPQKAGGTLAVSCNYDTPRDAFAHLIDKVSKRGTWHSNPYVLVYSFELVD